MLPTNPARALAEVARLARQAVAAEALLQAAVRRHLEALAAEVAAARARTRETFEACAGAMEARAVEAMAEITELTPAKEEPKEPATTTKPAAAQKAPAPAAIDAVPSRFDMPGDEPAVELPETAVVESDTVAAETKAWADRAGSPAFAAVGEIDAPPAGQALQAAVGDRRLTDAASDGWTPDEIAAEAQSAAALLGVPAANQPAAEVPATTAPAPNGRKARKRRAG